MVTLQFVLGFLFCVYAFAQEDLIGDKSQLGDVIKELKLLRKEVEENRKHIYEQENVLKALKLELKKTKKHCNCVPNSEKEKSESEKKEFIFNVQNSIIQKVGQSRKNRIIPPTSPPTSHDGLIAFYAYMSAPVNNIGNHHILIFDVIKSNSGLGLHTTVGVFTAPKSGFYVFIWTIRVSDNSSHGVELIVNGQQVGALFSQSGPGDNDTGSTTAVVHVNEGEDVFLRTTTASNGGFIYSDGHGYSSFAGWKLS